MKTFVVVDIGFAGAVDNSVDNSPGVTVDC